MVGPDAFTEVRYLQYFKQHTALGLIERLAANSPHTLAAQRAACCAHTVDEAELIVVAMGSINGTIKDVIDEMRADGVAIGLVTLVTFRPFPTDALVAALASAKDVLVIDKALDVGMGGPPRATSRLRCAIAACATMHSAIVGLGGGPVTKASLHRCSVRPRCSRWRACISSISTSASSRARSIARGKSRRAGPAAEASSNISNSSARSGFREPPP